MPASSAAARVLNMSGHNVEPAIDAAAPLVTPRSYAKYAETLPERGLGAVFATVASLQDSATAVQQVAAWLNLDSPGASIVLNGAGLRNALQEARLGIVLHFQGTAPFGNDEGLVTAFARLGVRVVQLTYNNRSLAGDGCFEPSDSGLSEFGQKVVRRLNVSGVVIDVSHVGVRTSLQAIQLSAAPVIASHSNARALCDSPRNLTDPQIRAIGDSGGVIGVCAFPAFVDHHSPTLERLVDHILYIGDLIGIDRVAVGLDFAEEDEDDYEYFGYDPRYYPRPPWQYPAGISGYDEFHNLPRELERRGLTTDEVNGVLSLNLLRVCEQSWDTTNGSSVEQGEISDLTRCAEQGP